VTSRVKFLEYLGLYLRMRDLLGVGVHVCPCLIRENMSNKDILDSGFFRFFRFLKEKLERFGGLWRLKTISH